MGVNNLPDLAAAPTKVDATTTQYNAITNALQGHQVMRDSDGVAEDNVSDIGRPSSGRPRKVYVGTSINVAGSEINLSSLALSTTGITSGKAKTSGYPNFLTPEGVTGGATNAFVIEAAATSMEMTIDGTAYTLEADLTSDDLALAPSSNNTCIVDMLSITGDPEYSKGIGEFGYWIEIDDTGGIGSEITTLDGTIQVFSITNGADTEIFIADVDTTNNKLFPIMRGIGGTDRIAFSDSDTITLLKAHYIFLDNDLATIDTTTTYPTHGPSAPAAPAAGDYHYYTLVASKGWHRYSGASWEKLGRIYLGYAICDSADCLYVEHENFDFNWDSLISINDITRTAANDMRIEAPIIVNVAGSLVKIKTTKTVDISSDLESGETEQTDKWYYLYLSNIGSFYFSTKAPRKYDERKGWYHPQEYWRCIGINYNGSGNGLIGTRQNVLSGIMEFDTLEYTIATDAIGSGITNTNMPIIVKDAELLIDMTTNTSSLGSVIFKEIPISGLTSGICKQYAVRYDDIGGSGLRSIQPYRVSYITSSLLNTDTQGLTGTTSAYIAKFFVKL